MAFDKLTEYSATNASNTSVGDVDVTDCLRSDLKGRIINAAIAAHDEEIP